MKPGPYKGLYSLVTLAGFVLLVWGYGNLKPWIILWRPETMIWTRHVALTLMPFAMILIVAAYLPTGWIRKAVKHPMLAAVKVWALAHLIANGDLGSMLLFGSFLAYGVIDRIALKRRGDNGPSDKTPHVIWDMVAIAVGGAAYGIIVMFLHPVLFGVEVMPV
jgi:uncharacterized membrane protein